MNEKTDAVPRDESTPTDPESGSRSGIRLPGCFPLLIGIVGLALVFQFAIRPMFLEKVDPNLKGPDISQGGEGNGADQVRGSFTDRLFQEPESPPEHPLDPALEIARLGLEKLRADVTDYTAVMAKRERVNGTLLEEEFLNIKVRHGNEAESINKAFYVRHLKPQSMAGQEAIWVENENDGKLIGHGAGIQRFVQVSLKPDNWLAMRGNRYPITELGIETLLIRMIEKGERDREHQDDCKVEYSRDLVIDGNPCTVITITHPKEIEPFEFHIAKIYIDDTLQLPIGYEGFLWPEKPGDEPPLVERYFYSDLQINPGLTPLDFDPDNPDYDYP